MGFTKWIFHNKKEAKLMGIFGGFFFLYYIIVNLRIISLLENGKLIKNGPFTFTPYRINLFNFDPSLYYGNSGSIISHPFFRFISLYLVDMSNTFGHQNIVILIVQSLIVSCTTLLIYSYCRNNELNQILSLAITGVFGFSSYAMMSALVPDSYTYAQFIIVLSVVYLQYVNKSDSASVSGLTTLAVFNFSITLTNIIPFVISTIVSRVDSKLADFIKKLLLTLLASMVILIVLALIDIFILPGKSWLENIGGGLDSSGYNYVAKFNWNEHSHVLNSLYIAPFLFSRFQVLDPNGLVAIVTQIKDPFPTVIMWVGYLILLLSIVGLILNLNKRNVWILFIYIGFSLLLHIGYGFGLATHEYDVYLYAGHYIFAIVLGISWLGRRIASFKPIVIILMALLILINITQIGNNNKRIGDLSNYISQVYKFQ